jgi:spermidine synthase
MRLGDPWSLALDYTRCMMGFLLLHPQPQRALMIGLGGGSLAKFVHRHLRATRVRVVELDERVVAAARRHFSLPPDDARLQVEIGDGAQALYPECCDVLVVDAFQDELHVPALATAAFYDAAFLALGEPGVLVVNFMDDDPQLGACLRRLEASFGGAVLTMNALYDPNLIAFACKGMPASIDWQLLRGRAARLQARLELPFPRYLSRLRGANRGSARELIIAR